MINATQYFTLDQSWLEFLMIQQLDEETAWAASENVQLLPLCEEMAFVQ